MAAEKYDKQGRAKYDRIVSIQTQYSFGIHQGKTEADCRKAFGWQQLIFWSIPISWPPEPKNHRAKRAAK